MLLRLALAVCAAAAVVALPFQMVAAQDATVATQKARVRAESGTHRKAEALQRICDVGSSAARSALTDLADDADDRTALAAIGALCREDFTAGRSKLRAVFEDDERSDLVRGAAIAALLQLRKSDGAAWSAVRSYVGSHTESGDAVREMALATAARLWGSAVSDE